MSFNWDDFNRATTVKKRRVLLNVMLRGFKREGIPDDAPPVVIAREWLDELRAQAKADGTLHPDEVIS